MEEDDVTVLHLTAFDAFQNGDISDAQTNWESSLEGLSNRDFSNDGDRQLGAKILNNLGMCYIHSEMYDKAEAYLLKSSEICDELDMPLINLMAVTNLAECLEKKAQKNQTWPDMPRLHRIRYLATEYASIVGDKEREFHAWLKLAKQISNQCHMEGYHRPLLLFDTYQCARELAITKDLYSLYLFEWAIHHLRSEIALKVKSEKLKSEVLFREYVDFCNKNEIEIFPFCTKRGFTEANSEWEYPPHIPEFEYL